MSAPSTPPSPNNSAAARSETNHRDNAAVVLRRVSRHLHKLNQGIGAGSRSTPASTAAAAVASATPARAPATPAPSSPSISSGALVAPASDCATAPASWRSRSCSLPVIEASHKRRSGSIASSTSKNAPSSASTRAGGIIRRAPSAVSAFSSLPHHETRIASNRGMYIRHRRLGAGSFGETWLCEWRPTEANKAKTGGGAVAGAPSSPRRLRSSSPTATRNSSSFNLNASGGSSNHALRSPCDDWYDEAPQSAAQAKASVTPPAVVSGLSCCSTTIVLKSKHSESPLSFSLAADRLYVVKIDAKQPSEIAETKKVVSGGALHAHQQSDTSVFSTAVVIQHPQVPSREVVALTPPPLRDLDRKQQEEEDAETFNAFEWYFSQRSSFSTSAIELDKLNGSQSSAETRSDNDANNSDAQFHAHFGASSQSAGSAASNGSAGNSRKGGVDVLKRKNTLQALRKHASTASRESSVLRDCAHPNIVGFVDEFEDETNRYLVMEYVDGGDLREEVQRRAQQEQQAAVNQTKDNNSNGNSRHFSVSSAMFLWVQALCAVEYLHRHNILHRDIKTANLLCSKKWRVLLADFGFGRSYEHDVDEMNATITPRGTPHYMSPEMFVREPVSGKADIWALGVVLFELLALQRPFEKRTNTMAVVASRVVNHPHLQVNMFRPPHMQVPPEVVALIDAMLQKDSAQRPTAKQLMRMPVVGAALDDYKSRVSKTAEISCHPIDKTLVAMLDEHIKLVRSDELSSPASRRRQARLRRVRVAKRLSGENDDEEDDDDDDNHHNVPEAPVGRVRAEKRNAENRCCPEGARDAHALLCELAKSKEE